MKTKRIRRLVKRRRRKSNVPSFRSSPRSMVARSRSSRLSLPRKKSVRGRRSAIVRLQESSPRRKLKGLPSASVKKNSRRLRGSVKRHLRWPKPRSLRRSGARLLIKLRSELSANCNSRRSKSRFRVSSLRLSQARVQPPLAAKSRSSKSIRSASARSKKLLRKLKLKRTFQRRLRCKKLTLFPNNQLRLLHL